MAEKKTVEERLTGLETLMDAVVGEIKKLRVQAGIPQTPSEENEAAKRARDEAVKAPLPAAGTTAAAG